VLWLASPPDFAEQQQLVNAQGISVSKEQTDLFISPAAICVITQADIRHSGMTGLPELLRMVPGMDVARIDGNEWAVSSLVVHSDGPGQGGDFTLELPVKPPETPLASPSSGHTTCFITSNAIVRHASCDLAPLGSKNPVAGGTVVELPVSARSDAALGSGSRFSADDSANADQRRPAWSPERVQQICRVLLSAGRSCLRGQPGRKQRDRA
jgi:hypothetical protein